MSSSPMPRHDDVLAVLARLDAPKIATLNGCPVYEVREPLHKAVLAAEAGVVVALTPAALETAFQDDATHAVYVPAEAFGLVMLERLLARQTVIRPIYWEA